MKLEKMNHQEIDEIHEKIDANFKKVISQLDKNQTYKDEYDNVFDTFEEYMCEYTLLFEYIPPDVDPEIHTSSTGYWRFHSADAKSNYEYRFYMNSPYEIEPDGIKFWCYKWKDYTIFNGYTDDTRNIGKIIWDMLEEKREHYITIDTDLELPETIQDRKKQKEELENWIEYQKVLQKCKT